MIPETLESHPPSDKLVYIVLKECGPSTNNEVADVAQLPKSTASEAIRRLHDADAADYRYDPTRPRKKLWFSI